MVNKSPVAGAFYSARPIEPPNYEFRATVALVLGMMICVPFATGIGALIVAWTIFKAPAAPRSAKRAAVAATVLGLCNIDIFIYWIYIWITQRFA